MDSSLRFASKPCRTAIGRARELWSRSTGPRARLANSQEVYRFNGTDGNLIWYVRNQKVASQSIISMLRKEQGSRKFQAFVLPHELAGFPRRKRGDKTWTVVREPLAAARAAYLEVSRRERGGVQHGSGYRSLPCEPASASARYRAFLRDVRAGRSLGAETFHAFPQALKLSVSSWIDAFVRLERLTDDGPDSGEALRRRVGVSLASLQYAPPLHATATTTHSPCSFNLTELAPEMCELYAADWACLPYETPAPCVSTQQKMVAYA